MKIEYIHASKYGNGATVAEEFRRDMAARGVEVEVHHVREVSADAMPPADLYLFSSPGRMGRPIKDMRRFLKTVRVPAGARYALLTTELAPKPDPKTGVVPDDDSCPFQKVRPIMNDLLQRKGLVEVAEDTVHVLEIEGPLEEGWQEKVEAFAARIPAA